MNYSNLIKVSLIFAGFCLFAGLAVRASASAILAHEGAVLLFVWGGFFISGWILPNELPARWRTFSQRLRGWVGVVILLVSFVGAAGSIMLFAFGR